MSEEAENATTATATAAAAAAAAPEDTQPSKEQAVPDTTNAAVSTAPGEYVPAPEDTQPSEEQAVSTTIDSAVSRAPNQSIPAPSEVPTSSSSYSYPFAPQPSTLPPATQQQQQQQPQPQINPSPATQHAQIPPANTRPPAGSPNVPPMQPAPTDSSAFAQQPQQQPHTPMTMEMAPPPPISMPGPTVSQYYADMSAAVTSSDGYEMVDSSQLLSARSKKDVKRRTKTGCLTCRRRRIKCDERHPVCRNCEKSKRECLGYDPVFKSQPGASALQPASPQAHAVTAVQPLSFDAPPTAHSHATSGAASYPSSLPETTASTASPAQEGVASPPSIRLQDPAESQPAETMVASLEGADKLELRQVGVDELLAVRGQLCQPLEPLNATPARIEDIKLLFTSYAVAIDRFLECHWYEAKGMPHLLANGHLLAQYAALLDGFNDPQIHEPTFLARLESRETRIIWDTMTMCRQPHAQSPLSDANGATSGDPELSYAVKRLSVFEALITGATLSHNPVGSDAPPEAESGMNLAGLGVQIKNRELQFWESIGRYVTIANDQQPECDKRRDSILTFTRNLLDSFENRDIIYSMAIIRNIAKYQPRKLKPLVGSTDEKDAAAKLYVACKFLEDESQGKGTNQTVKRLSSMVQQHWEQPSYGV